MSGTRIEIYRIVEETTPPYLTPGRPAEGLRFLYETISIGTPDVAGKAVAGVRAATASITSYCHGPHGLVYDTFKGGVGFLSGGRRGFVFAMNDYIAKNGTNIGGASSTISPPPAPIPNMVNCYDQASAVLVFARILGIDGHKRYVDNFGYRRRACRP